MIKQLFLIGALSMLCQPVLASQSPWVEGEGGAMRLIITADGTTQPRGVLEIKLNKGWKTYWRDPGDGGIPPSLSGDGMVVDLQFPAPERISENDQVFSGYHTSVSLPFILPETSIPIDKVTAFVGVCSEICVPFQAEFPLVRDSADADLVDAAFAALPKTIVAGEGIIAQTRNGNAISLKIAGDIANSTLFLAPERGLYLGVPEASADGFTVKVLKEKTPGIKVDYTLKTANGAVSGQFEMPK